MKDATITDRLRIVAEALRGFGSHALAEIVDEAADSLGSFIGSGRYSIGTWDTESQSWTPQEGCVTPWLNVDRRGLRAHLRELKTCGYSCHRTSSDSDAAVLVERTDGEPEDKILSRWKKG